MPRLSLNVMSPLKVCSISLVLASSEIPSDHAVAPPAKSTGPCRETSYPATNSAPHETVAVPVPAFDSLQNARVFVVVASGLPSTTPELSDTEHTVADLSTTTSAEAGNARASKRVGSNAEPAGPAAAPVASKWAAFDAKAGKVVCCLVVQGEAVTEAELESAYDIPGPWITDLTNGWNLYAAPYRPRVQLLRVEGALAGHEFGGGADARGGLLVPADARAVARDALEIGDQRYTVTRKDASLADDDGGVTTYSLRPGSGGAALKVEVPFATY